MATNPTVLRKNHDQLSSAHNTRLERVDSDMTAWMDDVEAMVINYYTPLLDALAQSSEQQDEELYTQLDRQYASRMASLQAARERVTEACAHLKLAIKPKNLQ